MRHSIRWRLFFSIIGIILIILIIGFFVNSQIFERYYLLRQRQELMNDARNIEKTLMTEPENLDDNLDKLRETKGYIIYLLNPSDIGPGLSQGMHGMMARARVINQEFRDQILNILDNKSDFKIYYNETYDNNFLRLGYAIDNKTILFIESPLQIVATSSLINRRFFLFISLITLIFGGIISYFFSKKFTEPIIQLNKQAKEMANLKFDRRFNTKYKDEVSTLGSNMNYLSNKLETTIDELNRDINRKEKLEEMRKTFIANISHELKTPIALIKGYSEGLKFDLNENKDEYVDIIIDETDKMNNLVTELLNLSDLESGNIKLDKEKFDISSLIDEILYKYNRIFLKRNIDVKVQKEDIVEVFADRSKIEEVITNYLNNALRHLDENKKIEIKVTNEENVRFEIYNSGQTIDASEKDKIWDSFYKVDKSRKREYESSGLGLYIVSLIIKLHQGKYGVKNKEDGVIFYFDLFKKD